MTGATRIGIFGGSFDPPHAGHFALAKAAVRELGLSRLFFVPARISPLKRRAPAPASERLRKLKSLARRTPKSAIPTLEFRRPGASYTVDTLRAFRKRFPKAEFFLILGSDALNGFKKWKDWRKILSGCTLAVGRRPGAEANLGKLGGPVRSRTIFLKGKMPDISSSRLRLSGKGL